MATTTNYGWETPDDTDLVKDGALASRTLGSSIDTTVKNLNPETTLGDISYRSSTANTNTRLAIGSTGNILTVVGGVPAWAAPAGGGKVLQVVQGTLSTQASTTSTTHSDTGLTVNITPSANTSKVLVLCYLPQNNTSGRGNFRLMRGATSILGQWENQTQYANVHSFTYLDSPATTSTTTYKVQFRTSSGTQELSPDNSTSVIVVLEIGA